MQNTDLQDWQEVFVVLCTFACQEEFPGLTEQLGSRLEFQFTLARASGTLDATTNAYNFRKNTTFTHLTAGRLERPVNIRPPTTMPT
jgi:protein transport protein SEC31